MYVWIIVDDALVHHKTYAVLASQGHRIQPMSQASGEDLMGCDAIHSPRAWQITSTEVGLLLEPINFARDTWVDMLRKRKEMSHER